MRDELYLLMLSIISQSNAIFIQMYDITTYSDRIGKN
jgi:hypothetical protein